MTACTPFAWCRATVPPPAPRPPSWRCGPGTTPGRCTAFPTPPRTSSTCRACPPPPGLRSWKTPLPIPTPPWCVASTRPAWCCWARRTRCSLPSARRVSTTITARRTTPGTPKHHVPRRLQQRLGGCGGGRSGAGRAGHRHRRLGAHSRRTVRHRRPQDDGGPGQPPRRVSPQLDAGFGRPAGALGGRCRLRVSGDARPGPGRCHYPRRPAAGRADRPSRRRARPAHRLCRGCLLGGHRP